ncbi:LptM family lipoprotein [Anaerovorax odorimutans]|uniref:LptM family lipoprotein n=1 Tax=Anaerovorax odorimutans TaxID=109327 RepID=UPI00041D13BB|nr:DUF5105 domain-containing protein [Anaerovorax odorimutans]
MKKILSIVLIAALLFSLASCGGNKPEQTVKSTLSAVKYCDRESAIKYIDYDKLLDNSYEDLNEDEKADAEEMIRLIFINLDYEIISSEVDGEKANVKTKITNTDMAKIFADFIPQLFTLAFSGLNEEEMNEKTIEIFVNLMNQKENETVTKTVDINLEMKDGTWKIDLNDELTDAIFGGMISAAEEMGKSFVESN